MSAGIKNLVADLDSTFSLTLEYTDPSGTPIDLTGYTATFETQNQQYAGSIPEDGRIDFEITDEETATWRVGNNSYRVTIESFDGTLRALLKGQLQVRK